MAISRSLMIEVMNGIHEDLENLELTGEGRLVGLSETSVRFFFCLGLSFHYGALVEAGSFPVLLLLAPWGLLQRRGSCSSSAPSLGKFASKLSVCDQDQTMKTKDADVGRAIDLCSEGWLHDGCYISINERSGFGMLSKNIINTGYLGLRAGDESKRFANSVVDLQDYR
ncbi:hypothetical protein Tco_0379369 [Tanacetum coccineum]